MKVAFDQEFDFDDFSETYEDLNRYVPSFTFFELTQFSKVVSVQKCLQLIFESYCRCYLELIRQLNTEEEGKSIHLLEGTVVPDNNRYRL